jgi:hypothetical protein
VPGGPRKRTSSCCSTKRGGEAEDEPAVHLRVEVEVEAIERGGTIPEAGFVDTTRQKPILPAHELVVDEGRDAIGGQVLPVGYSSD